MVDSKIVEYVANLARIDISEDEKQFLSSQLSAIINYIDKLKELDVSDVVPMRSAFTEENVTRPDKVKEKKFFVDILENTPSQENNHFKIPKVIE